jgi:hypothetical protein
MSSYGKGHEYLMGHVDEMIAETESISLSFNLTEKNVSDAIEIIGDRLMARLGTRVVVTIAKPKKRKPSH